MSFLRNDPVLKQRRRNLRRNQTEAEKVMWACLRNGRFCSFKFQRQYSVGPYVLDFYCPKARLAIELDGGQHADIENRYYDAERSAYLKKNGIDMIRFWNHDVLNKTDAVLSKLHSRITPPNPLLPQEGE